MAPAPTRNTGLVKSSDTLPLNYMMNASVRDGSDIDFVSGFVGYRNGTGDQVIADIRPEFCFSCQ